MDLYIYYYDRYMFYKINLIKYICNFDIFKIDGSNNINNITIDLENQNSLEMVEITNNNLKFYKLSKDEECILCNVKEKNLFYKFVQIVKNIKYVLIV